MARVYLETSFVSACVTTRTDPGSLYRREASTQWLSAQSRLHELFVSDEVFLELSDPDYPQKDAGLTLIAELPRLGMGEQVRGLAELFVRHKLMPAPAAGDALHVAVATVHAMEYLLTWNVRHLANPNKLAHLRTICLRLGLVPPSIITPDLLWERNDEPG
jgi:hypothetical protein